MPPTATQRRGLSARPQAAQAATFPSLLGAAGAGPSGSLQPPACPAAAPAERPVAQPWGMLGYVVPQKPPSPPFPVQCPLHRPHLHDASALRPFTRPGPAEDEDNDGLHEEQEAAAEQQQDSGGRRGRDQ